MNLYIVQSFGPWMGYDSDKQKLRKFLSGAG